MDLFFGQTTGLFPWMTKRMPEGLKGVVCKSVTDIFLSDPLVIILIFCAAENDKGLCNEFFFVLARKSKPRSAEKRNFPIYTPKIITDV